MGPGAMPVICAGTCPSMGPGAMVFTAIIWAVAIFLLIYARAQAKAGVLV